MVKIERNETVEISAKGEMVGITAEGIGIKDSKEGTVDTVKFEDLKQFVGKEISLKFKNKELA